MLPGLGPMTAIALMIPITYGFDPATGLILMAGVYYGAVFGGSTSSICQMLPEFPELLLHLRWLSDGSTRKGWKGISNCSI